MDTEMEDIHSITDPCVSRGLKYCEMRKVELEEGELIESPPQKPLFKAFNLATSEAKDKADRLAKIEIWEENMKREKTRKQCMGSVEGAARTRNVQAELSLISSTPSPLPQDSMHDTTWQSSTGSVMSVWTEDEREQTIHKGMYGDAYVGIYGDVYWDANVDTLQENPVSENLSRTRRKKLNRSKKRKKAAELQASLQSYGLLPVPLPPQSLQETPNGTVSHRNDSALRPKSNNNQREVREQRASREMTMEQTSSGAFILQQERLKQIADLRERIMARKASLQAQGLIPVSPSLQNGKENSIRTLPDGNPEANMFKSHNIQDEEMRQRSLEIMKLENLGSGASPQKDSSQHFTKSPKNYQLRLREQRDKMRAKTQQSPLDQKKSYGMTASTSQPVQNSSRIITRNYGHKIATPLQQEKDATVEKEPEPSNSIPDEIRVLIQRAKERRQRLSAPDNIDLVEEREKEQKQELLVPERIRLLIENTESGNVPANTCDVAKKKNLEMMPRQAVLPKQGTSLHANSAFQKLWQENSSALMNNGSSEVLNLEHDQGNHATEGAKDGEFFSAPKDTGFLPENLNSKIDPIIEH
ncbi:hypothetical protein EAE96_001634 [Botrytis aclada]|nr:hypothetical protein EAE96_001634 [Botrytis aclada]